MIQEETTLKKLLDMPLHFTESLNSNDSHVMRVAGGWIYLIMSTATFVPEPQKEEKYDNSCTSCLLGGNLI